MSKYAGNGNRNLVRKTCDVRSQLNRTRLGLEFLWKEKPFVSEKYFRKAFYKMYL